MRVPEFKQPTVNPNALPNVPQNVNYTADAYGGQVAGAIGQAGRAVGDVAAKWQAEDDEAAVKAADTAFNDELRVLMHDPQKGFYAQRGSNAMNAYGGLDEQIQALREKHGKGLANTKQQQMFGQVTESRRSSTLDQAIGYTQRERGVWLNTTGEARMQSAMDDAIMDPSTLGYSLQTVGREVEDRAARDGWAPEKTQRVIHASQSQMYAGQIERLYDSDPLKAAQMFAGATQQRWLTSEDTLRLQKGMKAAADKHIGLSIAQDLAAGREPRNLAGEFRKYGVIDTSSLRGAIRQESTAQGVNADFMDGLAYVESQHGKYTYNEASGATGPLQVLPSTGKSENIDLSSGEASIPGGVAYAKKIRKVAENKLRRPITDREHYLMWQQGPGGGPALLANPNALAVDVVKPAAVTGNGGHAGMTAGEFAEMQMGKFDKAMAYVRQNPVEGNSAALPDALQSGEPPAASKDKSSLDYQLQWIMNSDASADVKAIATSHVRTLHTAQKAAEKEASDQLYNGAYEQMSAGNISFAQLPTTVREKLTPSQKETLQKVEDRRLKGNTTSDTSIWYSAHQLSVRDPEAFARLNLLEEYGADLSQADLKHFAEVQKKIITGDATESAKSANRSRAMNLANTRLKEINIDPNAKAGTGDAKKVAAFQRQLFNAMNMAEAEKGRQLNEDETFAIIKSLTREVVTQPGWLWDDRDRDFMVKDKAKESTATTTPPPEDWEAVDAALVRARLAPTDENRKAFLHRLEEMKKHQEAEELSRGIRELGDPL